MSISMYDRGVELSGDIRFMITLEAIITRIGIGFTIVQR